MSRDSENERKLKEVGLTGRSPWGDITEIRTFGDMAVVEAVSWGANEMGERVQTTVYYPYVNGKPCHLITKKGWDKALLIALAEKYKTYPDFANLAALMLRIE